MPIYCDETDVARVAGGAGRLTELSDQDANAENDTDLVDKAIDAAEALVNSYARKQYEVPFSAVLPAVIPPQIRELTANLTVFLLKEWRGNAITEIDQIQQDARVKWLEDLSKGIVDPGITPLPARSGNFAAKAKDRPDSKAVSRDKLQGFS